MHLFQCNMFAIFEKWDLDELGGVERDVQALGKCIVENCVRRFVSIWHRNCLPVAIF